MFVVLLQCLLFLGLCSEEFVFLDESLFFGSDRLEMLFNLFLHLIHCLLGRIKLTLEV